jgi:probable HAF family extracellular repeat protein
VFNLTKVSLVIFALSIIPSAALAETYTYRLTEMGKGAPRAINKAAHATGRTKRFPCCGRDAYLWTGTQPPTLMDDALLPDFVFSSSIGVDINNKGQILVNAPIDFEDQFAAFIWNGTTAPLVPLPMDLSDPEESVEGHAINEFGYVTGRQKDSAFIWDGVTMRLLGSGEGRDINNANHVTGILKTEGLELRAFLWNGDVVSELGSLGGKFSVGEAINGKDQITGIARTTSGADHAFLWDSGLMTDLGTLQGFARSEGIAINNAAQIVGSTTSPTVPGGAPCGNSLSFTCGFLWEKGVIRDLNNLIDAEDPLKSTTTLANAIDINGVGQIAATGLNADGKFRSYLLSPRYKLTNFLAPTVNSWPRGSTVRVSVGVLDAENVRIPDARAQLLASDPCRVHIKASGAQTLSKTCMTYDAASNQFFFNWNLGATGTGVATIDVRVNYGAPGPLRTIRTKQITIN